MVQAAPVTAPPIQPAVAPPTIAAQVAPPQPTVQVCPVCHSRASVDAFFCETCGYDFLTGSLPRQLTQPAPEPDAPAVAEPAAPPVAEPAGPPVAELVGAGESVAAPPQAATLDGPESAPSDPSDVSPAEAAIEPAPEAAAPGESGSFGTDSTADAVATDDPAVDSAPAESAPQLPPVTTFDLDELPEHGPGENPLVVESAPRPMPTPVQQPQPTAELLSLGAVERDLPNPDDLRPIAVPPRPGLPPTTAPRTSAPLPPDPYLRAPMPPAAGPGPRPGGYPPPPAMPGRPAGPGQRPPAGPQPGPASAGPGRQSGLVEAAKFLGLVPPDAQPSRPPEPQPAPQPQLPPTPQMAPRSAPAVAAGQPAPAPATGPVMPTQEGPARWVAEIWIDPEWYRVQQAPEQLPSPGQPLIRALRKPTIVIGRGSASGRPDLDSVTDTGVSRRQAALTTDGIRWFLEDLGSSNGTFVGQVDQPMPSQPITGRVELGHHDRIYIGSWTRIVIRPALVQEADL